MPASIGTAMVLHLHLLLLGLAPLLLVRVVRNLVRDRAGRILVRTRIGVAGDALAHFDYSEHAAHVDGPELAIAGHHRQGVWRPTHVHHVAHPGLAHRHVAGEQIAHLLLDAGLIDARQV